MLKEQNAMVKHADDGKRTQRPYVGDTGRKSRGAADKATTVFGMVLLALIVGLVIGFAVFFVMNLSTWLTNLLWGFSGSFPFFPLVACTIGGTVIGLWTWWSHDSVKPLSDVMAQFKKTGSYRVNGVWKPVVSFLLPLVFGGSIGFEAGLTGLITAGCCWIRDQLKRAGLRLGALSHVTIAASLSAIFGTPLAGIAAQAEDELNIDDYDMRPRTKVVLYMAAAFGAFGGIRLFTMLFGPSSGLPRFEHIAASGSDFLWVLPCLALAYAMAFLFHASEYAFDMVDAQMSERPGGVIVKPILAGLAMGAVACALPYVLFPGEVQCEELMESWPTWTAFALLATGVLKALITPMCIKMGWVGGDLFPSIFAGVAAGYGLAMISGADPMLMVTVTTSAYLAGVLRKPLVAIGILFLCFPADGIIWMGVAAVIGATIPMPRLILQKD